MFYVHKRDRSVRLVWEGKEPLENVSERRLRQRLGRKRGGDNGFVILESEDGSYVQMLGGGVACCLEWRDTAAHKHWRAFLDPPKVPWREPSTLGRMRLEPEEFLFIETVVEAFSAFLAGRPFPAEIKWRDVTAELSGYGIATP